MKQFAQMSRMEMPETSLPENSSLVPDIFLTSSTFPTSHRPIPAPEPDPEPNPAPDNTGPLLTSSILLADWSLLFYALQQRLEQCASNDGAEHANALPFKRYESMHTMFLQYARDMKLLCRMQL